MLLVQDYLKTHTLADLDTEHGVNARVSTRDTHVFTLNYDQIRVVGSDPLACQCRGLVLRADSAAAVPDENDIVGTTRVLARPFDRFFNLGQAACAPVDFSDAVFFEKLDGTFCILYEDGGAWHVATRGTPDADVPIDGHALTFRKLFELALRDAYGLDFASWTSTLNPNMTFMFELTAAENQIVVSYPDRKVTLLCARDRLTGAEGDLEQNAAAIGVHSCPSHRIGSTEAAAWVAARDPAQFEGLVVRDSQGRRCKVKHPGYTALNHLAFQRSPRAMMRAILGGNYDDAIKVLPEYMRPKLRDMSHELANFLNRTDHVYDRLPKGDRKTLALAVLAGNEWMPYHMARLTGKTTNAHDFVQGLKRDGDWNDSTVDFLLEKTGAW